MWSMQEKNALFRSEVFPQRTRTGGRTVLIRGGSDDGGVRLVLHLQAVFPVWVLGEGSIFQLVKGPQKLSFRAFSSRSSSLTQ